MKNLYRSTTNVEVCVRDFFCWIVIISKCFYIKGQLISAFRFLFLIGSCALSRIQAFPKSSKDV